MPDRGHKLPFASVHGDGFPSKGFRKLQEEATQILRVDLDQKMTI